MKLIVITNKELNSLKDEILAIYLSDRYSNNINCMIDYIQSEFNFNIYKNDILYKKSIETFYKCILHNIFMHIIENEYLSILNNIASNNFTGIFKYTNNSYYSEFILGTVREQSSYNNQYIELINDNMLLDEIVYAVNKYITKMIIEEYTFNSNLRMYSLCTLEELHITFEYILNSMRFYRFELDSLLRPIIIFNDK